jgi:hypothetical protein
MPYPLSPEAEALRRARISASKKGKPSNFAGHTLSAEARAKISAANKGRKLSPEARAKMGAANAARRLPIPDHTRRLYEKLRRAGVSREDAIAECTRIHGRPEE